MLSKVEGSPATQAANGHANSNAADPVPSAPAPAPDSASNAQTNLRTSTSAPVQTAAAAFSAKLTAEETRVLSHIQARRMMRTEDTLGMGSFTADVLRGRVPRLERGRLGLETVRREGAERVTAEAVGVAVA